MAVPTARTDLSSVASSNSPGGSDTVASGTGPDDYLRAHASLIRQNYDDIVLKAPLASPTFTGTVALPSTWSVDGTTITATGANLNATANMTSATYTPTTSSPVNGTVASVSAAQYLKIGNVVTVSGRFTFTPTAPGPAEVLLSLPVITANFTGAHQLAGAAAVLTDVSESPTPNINPVFVAAKISTQTARLQWTAVSPAPSETGRVNYQFTYITNPS